MIAKAVIASLIVLIIIPAFAEKPQNTLDVMVFPETIEVKKNDTVNLVIVVSNYGDSPSEISQLYVNGVTKDFVKTPNQLLPSNSSLTINHSLNADKDPGEYYIPILVQDTDGNSGTVMFVLTVKDALPTIDSAGLALDKVLLLMTVFLIPAQIIERSLVYINNRHNAEHSHKRSIFLQDQKLTSFTKLREKVVEAAAKKIGIPASSELVSKIKKEVARAWLKKINVVTKKEVAKRIVELEKYRDELATKETSTSDETLSSEESQELKKLSYLLDPAFVQTRVKEKISNEEIDKLLADGADIEAIKKFLEDKNLEGIEKLEEVFEKIDKEITKDLTKYFEGIENKDDIIKAITKNSDFNEIYSKYLGSIDKESADAQQEKSRHQSEHELHVWLVACGLALIPAAILSASGIGVMQVLGNTEFGWRILDGLISALFIGSGTKPIHDIIDYIQKVRSSK